MADILITRGKNRTFIIGLTPEGTWWLQDHIEFKNRFYNSNVEVIVSINADVTDDMIQTLMQTGLDVEVK